MAPLDLRGLIPLETFYRFRFNWRCAVIRETMGESKEDAVRLVNCPCFISSFRGETVLLDWTLFPSVAQTYNVYLPGKFLNPVTREVVQLVFSPTGHIYEGDILVVTGLPFVIRIIAVRDPLFHHRHYEVTGRLDPSWMWIPNIPMNTDDMTPYVNQIVQTLYGSTGN